MILDIFNPVVDALSLGVGPMFTPLAGLFNRNTFTAFMVRLGLRRKYASQPQHSQSGSAPQSPYVPLSLPEPVSHRHGS